MSHICTGLLREKKKKGIIFLLKTALKQNTPSRVWFVAEVLLWVCVLTQHKMVNTGKLKYPSPGHSSDVSIFTGSDSCTPWTWEHFLVSQTAGLY